jgi:opacity protein-like surface antigen
MKKTILAALAASVFATGAAQAAGFDGFYAGVSAGMMKGDVKTSLDGDRMTEGNVDHSANFGVMAGYGTTFGNIYLGGELAWNNNQGELGESKLGNDSYTSETKSTKSFSLIPGYLLSPKTMVYGRLGKANADTEVKRNNEKITGDIDVIVYGFGVNHLISNNVSVRAEYRNAKGDRSENSIKQEVSSNGFDVALQYRF